MLQPLRPQLDGNYVMSYAASKDGLRWSRAMDLEASLPEHVGSWDNMRTPLSLINEGDGKHTAFFTAWIANPRAATAGL